MDDQQTKVEQEEQKPITTTLSSGAVEREPQSGECVGHCAHVSTGNPVWYLCENTTYLQVTTNVTGSINWLCICTDCEAALKADPKAQVLAGLGLLERGERLHLKPIAELHLPKAQA